MVRNGAVDVNGIHLGILEHIFKSCVSDIHAPVVAHFLEFIRIALANGVTGRVWMFLPNGNEFGSEAESNDRDIDLLFAHSGSSELTVLLRHNHCQEASDFVGRILLEVRHVGFALVSHFNAEG